MTTEIKSSLQNNPQGSDSTHFRYPNSILVFILCSAVFFLAFLFSSCKSNGKNIASSHNQQWKMGVALWSFNKFPLSVAVAKTDSAGLKNIEAFTGYKLGKEFHDTVLKEISRHGVSRIQELLNDKNMRITSIYGEGNNVDEWVKCFDIAKSLGVDYITGEPPVIYLKSIDSLAGLYNIKLALHNHWRGLSPYWHPDTVLNIINRSNNIKACADLGHWVRSGLDPVDCLMKLQGNILGIHLKDVHEMNNIEAKDVVVGAGVINFEKVITELRRQNFDGMIYSECELNWGNNVPDVIKSVRYFNELSNNRVK